MPGTGTGTCLEFHNPIEDAVSRVVFAPKSNNLLISSWDSNLRLYDVDCGLLRLEAPAPCEAALLHCCFQTDSESVAFSADSDGFIRRYDLHLGTNDTVGNHHDIATCVEYSNETSRLFSAGWDKRIASWDIRSANAFTFKELDAEVRSISLSGFDLMAAVGASVHVYDMRNTERVVDLNELRMDVQIRCIRANPNSRGYAAGSVDGKVAFEPYNPSDRFVLYFLMVGTIHTHIGICKCQLFFVLRFWRYTFRCHPKTKDGKLHMVSINDIAFNPLALVTGDNEGYVITWDAQSRRMLHEFPRYRNSVASLSYNHTGQLLAVASSHTYQEANEMYANPVALCWNNPLKYSLKAWMTLLVQFLLEIYAENRKVVGIFCAIGCWNCILYPNLAPLALFSGFVVVVAVS
ncbi:hypothetical protein Tsubulata_000514 [Turnera subulata]|uniref:Anaphase-promoting complex subunit 4 WD40 domain-containing protein n=1 Tax=Turnera subulata TaxID=218843 RepID=A0A9Q0JRA3_9ROSI|nr:hypothetical protein Tsubulata_000514 [Turnera subulata]